MNKVMAFVNEVRNEIKRITWPSRDELVGSTVIVCIVTLVFALILGSMDFIFNYVIKHFIL